MPNMFTPTDAKDHSTYILTNKWRKLIWLNELSVIDGKGCSAAEEKIVIVSANFKVLHPTTKNSFQVMKL